MVIHAKPNKPGGKQPTDKEVGRDGLTICWYPKMGNQNLKTILATLQFILSLKIGNPPF